MDIVLDASIGVKWFSSKNEDYLENALAIQDKKISGEINKDQSLSLEANHILIKL